jgi:superfamily II DNA or RNA helicase
MLIQGNRACIIHPTGTGKAVIISKFIIDNPSKRHLVCAPSSLIFSEIRKHVGTNKFEHHTYQGLMDHPSAEDEDYDFIFLDEFHRIGAEKWGKSVSSLIENNRTAKLIGTSATPIRYLDKGRDMAAEIFEGAVASEISLSRAILEGILDPPRYVSALYSISDEYVKLVKRIEEFKHGDKRILTRQLEQNIIDWQRSSGIDAVFKKYLSPTRKKVIVFCSSLEHMDDAQSVLLPIFTEIFGEVEKFEVYSKFGRRENNRAIERFLESEGKAKVIFSVEMLNEGIHSEDINTVVLFRETMSPIIFYQQIGRCFSMNQKEKPLIFDLVNNCDTIKGVSLKADFEEEREKFRERIRKVGDQRNGGANKDNIVETISIEFIDETREIIEMFQAFSCDVDNWEAQFNKAKDFFEKEGHLYVTMESPELCRWVISQRLGKKRKGITKERIERLTGIGMDWDYGIHSKWMDKFNELKAVIEASGGEPSRWENRKIGHWLWEQRQKHENGKLNIIQTELLKSIVSLTQMREQEWEKRIETLKAHKDHGGSFQVKSDNEMYLIVRKTRKAYQYGKLPEWVVKALKEMDFPLFGKKTFAVSFAEVKAYVELHNTLPDPAKDVTLTQWIYQQRYLLNKGELKAEWVEMLASIGILPSKVGEEV